MVKHQFTKNWSWYMDVEDKSQINEQHMDTVYRMDASQCFYGSCKTNCATNPYCLNGIGEKKLLNLMQKEVNNTLDKSIYFRKPNEHVGLVNLGATCYINAYLQVWFNNVFFRENLLGIKFDQLKLDEKYLEESKKNGNSRKMREFRIESNECMATNLQLMFTLMKETARKSIDPSFFIKALGLDENIQQDAQEFSQLFLTSLQSKLSSIYTPDQINSRYSFGLNSCNDLVQDLFQGECTYITKCSSCNLKSIRSSDFIELTLNIQNSQTIKNCIDDLLKEELMDGDNRYYCDKCQSKQNATRVTKLTRLPPVLNLQLLRFVYDRQSGYKKKLFTKIKFAELLDLNSYVEDLDQLTDGNKTPAKKSTDETRTSAKSDENIYHLGAILMHVGKSAYSGHYTAQIKNFQTNEWYNFNDEVITKLKKKQQLGCTEDELEPKSSADVKSNATSESDVKKENGEASNSKPVKTFSTANAYLLVYYRADMLAKMPKENEDITVMSNQSELIHRDNLLLDEWFNTIQASELDQSEMKNTERTIIHSIYENLWINKNTLPNGQNKGGSGGGSSTSNGSTSSNGSKRAASRVNKINSESETQPSPPPPPPSTFVASPSVSVEITPRSDYCFISTDFLRKWIGNDTNLSSVDLTGVNSLSKYLCAHKRLNPLATNRVKLVSRKGLDQMCSMYSLKLNDSYVIEAFNESTTRCWQCIYNCFDFLKCRERIKNDQKLFRQLLKIEYDESSSYPSSSTSNPIVKQEIVEQTNVNSNVLGEKPLNENEEDVIVLDKPAEATDVGLKISINPSLISGEHQLNSNKENEETTNVVDQNGAVWYWVGKESLKQWPNLAIKRLEAQLPSFKFLELANDQAAQADGNDPNAEVQPIQEIQEIQPVANASGNNVINLEQISTTLNYFNEDIVCLHSNLSPTPNKRLVCDVLWNEIISRYFRADNEENLTVFTNKNTECKICLKANEEHTNKKIQVKIQKDILPDLYFNKQRPTFTDCDYFVDYYVIMSDFIKEWRTLIKQSKFRDIKIYNQTLLCNHMCIPFNETTMDDTLVTVLTPQEWNYLSSNYEYDMPIRFRKKMIENVNQSDAEQTTSKSENETESGGESNGATSRAENKTELNYKFEFDPPVCEKCIAQNEIDKYTFENKKIIIRMIEEEETAPAPASQTTPLSNNTIMPILTDEQRVGDTAIKRPKSPADNDDDCEIISMKKARTEGAENENTPKEQKVPPLGDNTSNLKQPSQNGALEYGQATRRSKRSRKCKGDLTLSVSSSNKIKHVKQQIASQISKMISEQHLFFNNVELDNDLTLKDYRINKGDTLYLRIDKISEIEDIECSPYELAHLPEVGFKGTNLLR